MACQQLPERAHVRLGAVDVADLPIAELVENRRRSIAMLPPGVADGEVKRPHGSAHRHHPRWCGGGLVVAIVFFATSHPRPGLLFIALMAAALNARADHFNDRLALVNDSRRPVIVEGARPISTYRA
jgi:hypothetical protein